MKRPDWQAAAERPPRFPVLRWRWQRLRHGVPAAPEPGSIPVARPDAADPRAAADETRVTWLGQSAFLLQSAGVNLLTDPALSRRASPFAWVGPARLVAAPLTVADLPPIDAVLLSHDHYDHLDSRTCAALVERFGADLPILTPLGYRAWFARLGAHNVVERNWWTDATLDGERLQFVCLPAQHWTRRTLGNSDRLWCSWLVRSAHTSIYFCGDSGYCPAFREIRQRVGAPDIALMPIGAYEPRWFMKSAHMNPEEAVQAFVDLGAREFVAMHWGTFRLTDEPMLEPPVRVRSAWHAQGLPDAQLHVPKHGETLKWRDRILSAT